MLILKQYSKQEYHDIPDEQIKFVGGKSGVFAVWKSKSLTDSNITLIHFARGDDGDWREIFCFHSYWLKEICEVLNTCKENYQ